MLNLSQRLQDIRQYSIDGLREFSEHPTKYLIKAGKGFGEDVGRLVKDYWDAGVAAGSGLALTQYGNNLYGDYQLIVALLGSALSATGGFIRDRGGIKNFLRGEDYEALSFGRNMFAGFSAIAIGAEYEHGSLFKVTPNTFLEAFLLGVSGVAEYLRRTTPVQVPQINSNGTSLEQSI